MALAACAPRATGPLGAKTPIVVIGAGLSGLVVARDLALAGRDVVVLEAQARPGGRILTLRSPIADGAYVECGATHVIGDPELLDLLRAVGVAVVKPKPPRGLATVEYFGGKRVRLDPGTPPTERVVLDEAERKLDFIGRIQRYFAMVKGVDPESPRSTFAKYDGASGLELLASLGASPGYIQASALTFVPEKLEETSAAFLLQQVAGFFRDFDLGAAGGRIEGGSDRLPFALARELGARVLFGAEVKRIEQLDGRARVSFVKDGQLQALDAVRVVSAIPYSVLRHIEIAPGLSAAKARVIAELPMASVARIFAEVDRRFWSEQGEAGDVETDEPLGAVRDETKLQAGNVGVLGAYLSGDAARRWTAIAKAERQDAFLNHLERIHPGTKTHFAHFLEHSWDEDPYARGAYAWMKKGQWSSLGPALTTPDGLLHFAGDHTSARPGWMHGALSSAKRVVREILAR
ncbi:flavin monoamine oxidase family protein [soil metagenome]